LGQTGRGQGRRIVCDHCDLDCVAAVGCLINFTTVLVNKFLATP
jgi:hypothetical protein